MCELVNYQFFSFLHILYHIFYFVGKKYSNNLAKFKII